MIYEEALPELRWNGPVLQQQWVVKEIVDRKQVRAEKQWRDVPTKEIE